MLGAWAGWRGGVYHRGVLPERQRSGVGRSLLTELERRMRAKGVLKMNAIVYDDNSRSLGLFASLGYVQDRKAVLHGKVLTEGDERWADPQK